MSTDTAPTLDGVDLIDEVISFLRASASEIAPDRLVELEVGLRQNYGDGQHYIRVRPARAKCAALAAALRRGLHVEEAFAAAGVSRAHGYRLLGMRAIK